MPMPYWPASLVSRLMIPITVVPYNPERRYSPIFELTFWDDEAHALALLPFFDPQSFLATITTGRTMLLFLGNVVHDISG